MYTKKPCFQGKTKENTYTPKSLQGGCEGPLRAVLVYRFWPPIKIEVSSGSCHRNACCLNSQVSWEETARNSQNKARPRSPQILAHLDFQGFSLRQFPCFCCTFFPSFSNLKDFKGSAERIHPVYLSGFPCFGQGIQHVLEKRPRELP